jgi:CHAT domain-containing protein
VADGRYRKLVDDVAELDATLADLRRADPNAKRGGIAPSEELLAARREALSAYFDGVGAGLAKAAARKRNAAELATIQGSLRELGDGAVAVYTLMGADRVTLLVYTATKRFAREANLGSKEVARRVFAMREAVATPESDPREAAARVWEILVAPIAQDLDRAGARTIFWSLDGPLRYVPTSALWDSQRGQWFVERFRSVQVTPASLRQLTRKRTRNWRALGLGATKAHGEMSALPYVKDELLAVVRDGSNSRGALPGKRILDADFTHDTFFRELKAGWPVVHLASHYVFRPSTSEDEGSYLLLGDGHRLTLKELSDVEEPVFDGIELLALSACETGVGEEEAGDLPGAEIDGLAMVAQQRGAAAVLATLWPVADKATSAFMGDLYRRLKTGLVSKAEALRQAQLFFVLGGDAGPARKKRGMAPPKELRGPAPNTTGTWAHPFYWAPFALLGNGT